MPMKLKRKYTARYDESPRIGMNRRLKSRREDLGDVTGSSVIDIVEELVLVCGSDDHTYPRRRERIVERYIFAADCLTLEQLTKAGLAPPLAPGCTSGLKSTHLFVATSHKKGYWAVKGRPHIFITCPDLKEQKRQEQRDLLAQR